MGEIMVQVKIQRINKEIDLPSYKREGDAGIDLRSAEEKLIKQGAKVAVKTGVRIVLPEGYAGLIWDRSGLAAKNAIHCLAGVIDCTFRGEMCVVMHNLGDEDFLIEKNMRIAQLLVQPVATAKIEEVDNIDLNTVRGENKFGSSGLK